MKRSTFLMATLIFFAVFLLAKTSFADKQPEGIGQWLQEVGVTAGYVDASLKRKDDLQSVPLGLRFGFDLRPFTKKFGLEPKGLLELMYEPFISPIFSPASNVEFGVPVSLKYGFPITEKFYPYIQVGIGPYYTTLHTREQSTQFNLISQGGGGVMFFFREHWALSADYRWRHVSNAGIKKPNAGIDAHEYTLGLSYYF